MDNQIEDIIVIKMEVANTDLENMIKLYVKNKMKSINNFEIYEMLF